MIHPKIEKLSDQLVVLEKNKQFDDAEMVAKTIVSFFSDSELEVRPFRSSQFKEKTKNRFFPKPGHGEDLPCTLEIIGGNTPIDFKLFWTKKVSKQIIAGITNFSPNFEDSPIHEDCNMGIDIIIPNSTDRVILVLSDKYILRTLELHGKLTATQHEILHKWIQNFDFSNKTLLHQTLWNSFNIKVINNKFYESISRTFMNLVQHLEHQGLDSHESRQFTNRLIGRVVFCWFLKKKNVIAEKFDYFSIKEDNSTEYYNKVLSKLFFYTLNAPVEERTHSIRNIGKDIETPYLNGGLFEKRGYDHKDEITFPARFFHDFFEFLNEYNFTTDESTSTYQQVAVDPEMLGRIFENLLAEQNTETGEQARKAKGAFYTPREIVDYMCKEGLKTHLSQKLSEQNTPENDIEKIIDQLFVKSDSEYALNSKGASYDTIQMKYRGNIIGILDNLTVIDPACGSGAFPMGMLQTILRCYERVLPETKFDPAEAKKNIIENSLFGVDIEPMAVEISRLRTWLSIVVDEVNEHKIEPLPNLDFKFLCANSLIGLPKGEQQVGLDQDHKLKEKLNELRHKYYRARTPKSKEDIKKEYIGLLQNGMFETKNSQLLKSFNVFDASKSAEFFDQKYMFGQDNFDICIANPPYVRQEKIYNKEIIKEYYGDFFNGRSDLYTYFIKHGFNILKKDGIFCYITSNKFFVRGYGENTRKLLSQDVLLKKIINFGELPVFQASVDSAIILAQKTKPKDNTDIEFVQVKNESEIFNLSCFFETNKLKINSSSLGKNERSLESPLKISLLEKIKSNKNTLSDHYKGTIFAGIKTGYDNAFVIDKKTKEKIINEDSKSIEIIKPWLKGKDVRKWVSDYKNLYLIYIPLNKIEIEQYPAIKKHLLQFEDKLNNRATNQKRFEIQQPQERFTDLFNGEKIIYPDCAKEMRAAYDNSGSYGTMAMYFLPYDPLILGILNSKLFDRYSRMTFATFGDPWKGGRVIFKTIYMSKFPICKGSDKQRDQIIELVKKIIETKVNKTDFNISEEERKINILVYKIYNLTYEEVKIIEPESILTAEEYESIN